MSFTDQDLDFLVATAREAAEREILPRFRTLTAGDIAQKTSAIDLVTQADLNAELLITRALRERFPGALIVGEEAYDRDRSVVPAMREADLAFTIDPVDGTFNFAAGLPLFGTILSVTRKGETVAGVIHEPLLGEAMVAMKGEGAYLRRADGTARRLSVASPAALSDMTGIIAYGGMVEPMRSRVAANLARIRLVFGYNCSAYEYWMVASGRLHFIGHGKLMPWDHLAGVLIHQEAGGYSARFDGSPYLPGDTDGGIISAPDRECWETIRREIIGEFPSYSNQTPGT